MVLGQYHEKVKLSLTFTYSFIYILTTSHHDFFGNDRHILSRLATLQIPIVSNVGLRKAILNF